jgi:hypothetical protein
LHDTAPALNEFYYTVCLLKLLEVRMSRASISSARKRGRVIQEAAGFLRQEEQLRHRENVRSIERSKNNGLMRSLNAVDRRPGLPRGGFCANVAGQNIGPVASILAGVTG